MTLRSLLLLAVAVVPFAAAAEPAKFIPVYVTPYYEAARAPGGAPAVAVAKQYDALFASTKAADVLRARDAIAKDNALLTPMTLMVLAIRLYDVGQRDDSVFWFYAAKNRYSTLAEVANVRTPQLEQVEDAVRNFALLAGPYINGYAFCNVANQQTQQVKALKWVKDNPYQALFLPQVPALPGDRKDNLRKAIVHIEENVAKERDYLSKPANLAKLAEQRKANGADEKYCWK